MSESTLSGAQDPFDGRPRRRARADPRIPARLGGSAQRRAPRVATLPPMLADIDAGGRVVSLLGHMARRNPLLAALETESRASLLFTGPQAYVSPGLVLDPDLGSHLELRSGAHRGRHPPASRPGGTKPWSVWSRTMDKTDQTGWRPRDVGGRYDAMQRAIIAFEADVTSLTAKFKLGQDETDQSLAEILAGHPDPVPTRWMRRMNTGRVDG
ncbi:FMN-binding negative transcriptional regulator [Caulobacter segnis]